MELNAALVFVAVWFLVSLLGRAGRRAGSPPKRSRRADGPPARPTSGLDATQREGSRIELMLREFQRTLEEANQAARPGKPPIRVRYELPDARSLETEPEVTSLEGEVRRPDRREVDQDEEAEQVAARRIDAAAARDQAVRPAVRTPREEIRPEPADHTAVPAYTAKQLRDAVVWREILGPPVSER
jgi:hypothetical protein